MSLEILEEFRAIGVEVIPQGENLVIRPASKVPAELKERLKAHKPEILALLRQRPATCAASCYEAAPGRWIHRPWDGCKTVPQPNPALAVSESECRHCDGAGECSCPACTLRRTANPVPCLMCYPMERQIWLAAHRPETCWHCGGSQKCDCIFCEGSNDCQICGGSGKAAPLWVN